MNNVKLTKKSFNILINRHQGAGRIFIHIGTNEITSFDFWLGRNGFFYTNGPNGKPELLTDSINQNAIELHRQEVEMREQITKEQRP